MEYDSFSRSSAIDHFRQARSRATVQDILARLTGRSNDLLSYEEVRRRLRGRVSARRELKDIPLAAIVGSVGRYTDFTREFLPRRGHDERRWARVATAMDELSGTPPVEVYQIGESYFVLDGNHRVSIARQRGETHIEAYVTMVYVRVPLSPNSSPDDLILAAEYADFLELTNLDAIRPDADLRVTNPGQYRALTAEIEARRRDLSSLSLLETPLDDAVASWYDDIYLPIVAIIRERGLLRGFPGRTETDLYVWISRHRARLEQNLGWMLDPAVVVDDLTATHAADTPGGRMEREEPTRRIAVDVLVAISGEPDGWRALEQALLIAPHDGGRLNGLHVVGSEAERNGPAALAVQAAFDERCHAAGMAGNLAIGIGAVTPVICERARWNDLVVVSLSHPPRTTALARLRPGFHTLVRRCPRPILAVPGEPKPLRSALLSYDGSPKANEALFIATYLALQWGMRLSVLTILESDRTTTATLDAARRYLDAYNVEATYLTAEGLIAHAILTTALEQSSDLILMGGYGHSPLLDAVIGGTVDQVLRESDRPVLICR